MAISESGHLDENGIKFVPAKGNELQVDIDRPEDLQLFHHQLERLVCLNMLEPEKILITRSPGGNHHITVTLAHGLPVLERVCLQAILGSDRVREALNYARAKNKAPFPVLFYELEETADDL